LSVNFAGLSLALSSRVLSKGTLTSLTVDMHHFQRGQALDEEGVADAFSGLQHCGKLESLTFRHSRIVPADFNTHILPRLAGNKSIKELAVSSDIPLHGRGEENIDTLATTFELLGTCVSLKTFRFECPPARNPARVAFRQVYIPDRDSEIAQASVRIAGALRLSSLHKLVINGLVLHGAVALGLAQGIGGNTCLEELDLSGCSFPLNQAPQFIRNLMANRSICLMAMPGPQTMTFVSESDGTLCNLTQVNGGWEVDDLAPGANADFDAFEGDGAAYAQNFSYVACAKVAHSNAHLRRAAIAKGVTFNIGDLLGIAYTSALASRDGKVPDTGPVGPDLFSIAGGLVFKELVAAGSEKTAIRMSETAQGVGAPLNPLISENRASLRYQFSVTPLQVAAMYWDVPRIDELCSADVDVNAVNAQGDTALHALLNDCGQGIGKQFRAAADQKDGAACFLRCVKTLVDAGADLTMRNADDESFLECLARFVDGKTTYPAIPALCMPVLQAVLRMSQDA
jgi:hypothetical protein